MMCVIHCGNFSLLHFHQKLPQRFQGDSSFSNLAEQPKCDVLELSQTYMCCEILTKHDMDPTKTFTDYPGL